MRLAILLLLICLTLPFEFNFKSDDGFYLDSINIIFKPVQIVTLILFIKYAF